MIRSRFILPALLVAAIAAGCSRPSAPSADARALEGRVAKLEAEVKSLAAAKADLTGRLAAAENQARLAEAKFQVTAKERDEARTQLAAKAAELAARTNERDAALAQFDGFRKSIRDVLGQADTTAGRGPVVAIPASKTGPAPTGSKGL